MPKLCSISSCLGNERVGEDGKPISYYTFPKDPQVRDIWVKLCNRHNKSWSWANKRVCSKHFKPDDYEDRLRAELLGLRPRKLNKDAVPSLFLQEGIHNRIQRCQKVIENERNILIKEIYQNLEEAEKEHKFTKRKRSRKIVKEQQNEKVVKKEHNYIKQKRTRKSLKDRQIEVELTNDDHTTLTIVNQSLQNETETLKYKNEALQNENEALKYKTKTLQKENETLKLDKNEVLKDENKALKIKNEALQNEKETMKYKNGKLKQNITKLEDENHNLKKKVFELQQNLRRGCVKFEERAKIAFKDVFTPSQVRMVINRKQKVHWRAEDLSRALTLMCFSKAAYKHMKHTLNYPLPSKATLQQWAAKIKNNNGVQRDKDNYTTDAEVEEYTRDENDRIEDDDRDKDDTDAENEIKDVVEDHDNINNQHEDGDCVLLLVQ